MIPKLEINSKCIKCDNCRLICPESSIFIENNNFVIENWSCTLCGLCIASCPSDAIKFQETSKE